MSGDQIVRNHPAHRNERAIEERYVDEGAFAGILAATVWPLDGRSPFAARHGDHRHAQRRMKGLGTSRSLEIHTHLVCRYSLIASMPDSRPIPEFLNPPNGDVKLVAR